MPGGMTDEMKSKVRRWYREVSVPDPDDMFNEQDPIPTDVDQADISANTDAARLWSVHRKRFKVTCRPCQSPTSAAS